MQKAVSDAYVSATAAQASVTSCSFAIGMAFDLRTCKSSRSQRIPRESCVRNRDNKKPYINLNRAIK